MRRYQAVKEERRKWEARESRLVTEIVELKRQLKAREATQVQGRASITSDTLPVNYSSSVVVPPIATSSLPALSVVSAPVTFTSNQLPASDSTNSLHGATDAPVTSHILLEESLIV